MDPALASFGLLHGTLTGGTGGKEKSYATLYLQAHSSVSEKQSVQHQGQVDPALSPRSASHSDHSTVQASGSLQVKQGVRGNLSHISGSQQTLNQWQLPRLGGQDFPWHRKVPFLDGRASGLQRDR